MDQQAKPPVAVTWGGYLAITLLVVLPLSVLIVRSGAWQQGLLLYAIACLGSTALLILFIIMLLLPGLAEWRAATRRRALFALPGTLALLSLTLGGNYPPIHDVTTDPQNPPRFVAAKEHRPADANPLDIDPEVIEQQLEAYPDLQTLRSPLGIDGAFTRAAQVARQLGWEIYNEDRAAGIIEAVDTTSIMAFKDDVVIRVRGDAEGAYVDLRSVSRVGRGDIGANAKRIRAFRDAFETRDRGAP